MIQGFSRILTATSSLALASTYLLAWAGIGVLDSWTSIRYLGLLIIMEFVQLLLGLPLVFFLACPQNEELRRLPRRVFLAFLAVPAVALAISGVMMSVSAGALWPMIGVILLLAGKWDLYVRPPRTELESRRVMADAAVRLSALFFLLLPCVIIPFPSWNAPSKMEEFGDVRPAGLLVLGAAYFGLFGLFGHRLDKMVEEKP
jgi:hypothetical protein